ACKCSSPSSSSSGKSKKALFAACPPCSACCTFSTTDWLTPLVTVFSFVFGGRVASPTMEFPSAFPKLSVETYTQ
ncbi:hypothetical protein, partial [Agaribacter flavus]